MRMIQSIKSIIVMLVINITLVSGQISVGDSIIHFRLPDTSGQAMDSRNLNGDIILLNFFATWCGPCRVEAPQLQDSIWNEYKDQNLTVVGLDFKEHVQPLKQFINDLQLTYPIVRDTAGHVFNAYGFRGFPSNVLIDRDGRVAYVEEGYNILELQDAVDSLLKVTSIQAKNSGENRGPDAFRILGNYPNPFNSRTTVEFYLPKTDRVNMRVYDITGRKLFERNKFFREGENKFNLDMENRSSGVYFYRISRSGSHIHGKMILKK